MKFQVKLGNKLNAVRRILNLLVCFAILLSLSQTAFAAESSDDEENKILALTMANDAPRTVDLLYYYALKEIGYTPTISIVGNTTTLRMANVGERDGVAFQTKYVGDTFKDIIMVPHYLAELDLNAYINTKNPVNVKTWDDLSNLRVGMIYEKPYLERQVPKDAIVTKFNSSYKLFQSLARNEVDVAVALRVGNQEFWSDGSNVLSATLEHVNGYAYFNKKHASIVPSLSDALTKMYNDGTAQKILNHEIMGEPNEKKLILRISSYNSDSPWDHAITNEMPKNPNVEFINIDLNADRVANHEESWNIITSLLRQDLIGKSPDLIFVSDNEALEFIKECYLQFFETVPVVFCGINNYTPKTIEGFEEYFTGVTETVSALETVNLATKLFPNTKNVFVINDYSRSGKAWRAQIESQLQGLANINVTYNENKPFEDLASRIKDLPENSIIICGEYQSYDDGKDYLEEGSHRLFAEYSSVPIFGLKSTSFGYGQVGGMYSDSQLQGKLAANLINQILETKSMPSVVQPTQSQNKWKFDITPMEEFSLKKADVERLVDNAEYINEPVPFYKSNFVTFVAASLFLGLFVVTTFIFSVLSILTNNRNKILAKSQASLYTAEQLLEKDMTVRELKEYIETVIDTSPIGYALVLDNTVVECNQYMSNHLGFSKGRDLQFNAEIQSFLSNVDGHLGKSVTVPFSTRQGEERRYFLNTTTVEYQGKNAVIIWCTEA